MSKVSFDQAVALAAARDPRFAPEGYAFLREALEFTMKALQKGRRKEVEHVSGRELCHGWRDYALKEFGPMVPTIMEAWGVRTTRDVGDMVFSLIDCGAFSRSRDDRREDFDEVFSFDEAFVKPFLPVRAVKPGIAPRRRNPKSTP